MWLYVILIYSIFNSTLADAYIPEIVISVRYNLGEIECSGTPLTIVQNSLVQVYINYSNNIYHARCNKASERDVWVIDSFEKRKNESTSGYLSKIIPTINTSGDWNIECSFYTMQCKKQSLIDISCYYTDSSNYIRPSKLVKCYIPIHILKPEQIGSIPTGSLSVNGMTYTTMGQYVKKVLFVYEGKPMDFVCKRVIGGFVQISYENTDGRYFTTNQQQSESVYMYMKMRAAVNNGTYVNCSITDKNQKVNSLIQILLYVNRDILTTTGFISFNISGVILPEKTNIRNTEFNFEYLYYSSEKLMISVVKDHNFYGISNCDSGGNAPYNLSHYSNSDHYYGDFHSPFPIILEQGGSGTFIQCTVACLQESGKSISIKITFIYQPLDFIPFIADLTRGDILLKYSNTTTNVILYEGNRLNKLRCYNKEYELSGNTFWWFKPNEVSTITESNDLVRSFYLLNNRPSTIIQCRSNTINMTTNIELFRKEPIHEVSVTEPSEEVIPLGNPIVPNSRAIKFNKSKPKVTASYATNTVKSKQKVNNVRGTQVLKNGNKLNQKKKLTVTNIPPKPTNTFVNLPNIIKKDTQKLNKSQEISEKVVLTKQKELSTDSSGAQNDVSGPIVKPTSATPVQLEGPAGDLFSGVDNKLVTPTSESGNGHGIKYYLIIAAYVIAFLILIAVIWTVIYAIKKSQRSSQQTISTNIDYQNLPQHNEGPMTTPSQWDSQNSAYAVPNSFNIQDLYSKPIPKSQRGVKLEPTYSEVHDSKNVKPSNASISQNEPSYTEVCRTDTYAAISKNISSSAKASNTEPAYAEIGKNEPTYAEIGKNKPAYAEVSKNEPAYAEIGKNEPAYAEVGKIQDFGTKVENKSVLNYAEIASITSREQAKELNKRSSNYATILHPQNCTNNQDLTYDNEIQYANFNNK